MSNLLDAALKADVLQAMDDIWDTFKRSEPITFYKRANQEVVVFDPDYNADFQEFTELNNITATEQSEQFEARIWYLDRQPNSAFIEGGEEAGVRTEQMYNRIKIQVKQDAFDYLATTIRFSILGEEYKISEGWRRIGILDEFNRYQIILQRIN